MQIIRVLNVDLVAPAILLRQDQIYERRLIIRLERRPALQVRRQYLASLVANGAFGPHRRPRIKQIKAPLAIPQQEAAGVEADPGMLLENEIRVAMDDEVVRGVTVERDLEGHVREERIAVHPPDPLHLRVRQH
ncbi:unnamed protein product [Musa hybrid cultivar]